MIKEIKFILLKIKWHIKGGYNEEKFWNEWGATFIQDDIQHRILPEHVKLLNLIKNKNPDKILEVGIGFGRNIKYFINKGVNPKKFYGIDISNVMLKGAKGYIKNKKVNIKKGSALKIPFKDEYFDLVFAFAVLMHVKPKSIKKAICEIARVTKSDIVIIEQNYKPSGKFEKANWYTFIHKYDILFKELGLKKINFFNDKKNGYYYYHLVKKAFENKD